LKTREEVESETRLTGEIEGWITLTAPALATHLEASREKYAEHGHRKLCVRIVNMFRKAHPMMAIVDGTNVGRPIYIVDDNPLGPDEISVAEIFKAMEGHDPKGSLKTLLQAKQILGGGVLTSADPVS